MSIMSATVFYTIVYFAGLVAQQRENYAEWSRNGLQGTMKPVSHNFFIAGYKGLTTSAGWQVIFLCLFALSVFFVWYKYFKKSKGTLDKERNLTISSEGTYGTADWMNALDFGKVLRINDINNIKGIVLGEQKGKAVVLPEDTMLNRHIAVYGASGTMKSRAFVRPYIFGAVKRGESLIITDSKGEMFSDTSEYLKKNGYDVKVFNLVMPECSDSWNCLSEVEGKELMAQVFTDVIIKNTSQTAKGDAFWDNAEHNLLKALVLYVDQNDSPFESEKNMGTVYSLLSNKTNDQLDAIFNALPPVHPAKGPYRLFQQSSETVRGSVIIGLGSRLQVFQNELICKMTATDEIDLVKPAKEKCAYFCIISDQDSTLEFLSSLFFSFLFIKLVRYADLKSPHGKCDIPVNFVLDEFTNTGQILDINKKMSTIRSRGLNVSIIFQNIAQLKNRYPDDVWLELVGNCDTQLFLGCTDPMTAEFVSERTGDATVGVTAAQYTKSPITKSAVYRDSQSVGKRKLLTPDEVLRFPNEEALVILRGQKPLKVNKLDYTKFPQSKELVKSSPAAHIPDWQKGDVPVPNREKEPQERKNRRKAVSGQNVDPDDI